MTESISGFLGPEERAALAKRRAAEQTEELDDVARLIIAALAVAGPTPLSDLIKEVGQRPRLVMVTIDQLEQQGLIEVSVRDVEEVAALTETGRQKANSL
jgi:DNA-binding MarR family transcriptional regulator